MEQIKLDLIPGKQPPVCHVSQFDDGRSIRLDLYEGGQVYTLGGTEVITLKVRKPDGNFVTKAVTATLGNTYVTITTTEQMTAVAGMNMCELEIKRGGNTLGTMNFMMYVELDPIDGAHASDSVIYNITQLVNEAMQGSAYVTELEDIRNGADGKTYNTAGDAVRGQFTELNDIEDKSLITRSNYSVELGGINVTTGALTVATNRARTNRIYIGDNIVKIKLTDAINDYRLVFYDVNGDFLAASGTTFSSGTTELIANYPSAYYFRAFFRNHADPTNYDYTNNLSTLLSKIVIREYIGKKVVDNIGYGDTPILWEVGSLVSGALSNNKQSARTAHFLKCDSNSYFEVSDANLTGKVVFYDSNFAFLRDEAAPTPMDYGGAAYCKLAIACSGNNVFENPNKELDGKYSARKMLNSFDDKQVLDLITDKVIDLENDTGHVETPILQFGVISTNGPVQSSTTRAYCEDYLNIDDYKTITINDNSVQFSWRNYDDCGNFFYINSGWTWRFESVKSEADNAELTYFNFEIGTLRTDTGKNQSSTTRIRTKNFVHYNSSDEVTINAGYKASFRFYNENYTLIARTSFGTTSTDLGTAAAGATVISGHSIAEAKYYRIVCAKTDDSTISTVTQIISSGVKVVLYHVDAKTIRFSVRYSNDATITSLDTLASKIIIVKNIDNNFLYEKILESEKVPEQYASPTGNSTIRAVKEHNYIDGSRSVIEWFLLEEPKTHRFYYSKDLKTKKYLFTFSGDSDVYSWGITADGDVIAVQDAATFPWVPDPDRGAGYYIGDEDYRQNPIVFLAREQYSVQHTVDFGNDLKPCGWDKNIRCRVMSDGSFMFVEYTRPTVLTCNLWKLVGDPLDKSNWVYNQSMQLTLSGHASNGLKHYHYIQEDQFTGVVYVGTGDDDVGSMAWYSTDGGETFTQISVTVGGTTYSASELYFRFLNYVFTDDFIYWAGDTNKEGKHKVFRCERDANGVIDTSTLFKLAELSWYDEKDRTKVNRMATYGLVYVPECNTLLCMERIDGSPSGIDEVPIRVVDLSIADADIVYNEVGGIVYNSSNVKEVYWLKQIGDGTDRNLGFECRYMEYFPIDGIVNVGYNLATVANLQEANPNRGFGNTGEGQDSGINSYFLKLSKNGEKYVLYTGMNYN